MAGAAVLLPARLETRFDEVDGVPRMRVIVVPDRCWFNRHRPASDTELDLLQRAVDAAEGALVDDPAVPTGANAASAFDALAGAVGPGRALWLARTFPAVWSDGELAIDREAGPRANDPHYTAIDGLPEQIDIVAVDTTNGRVPVASLSPRPHLVLRPDQPEAATAFGDDADADTLWPRWCELVSAGLAAEVLPSPIDPNDVHALFAVGVGTAPAADVFRRHLDAGDLAVLQAGQPTNTVAGTPTVDLGREPSAWRALADRAPLQPDGHVALALCGSPSSLGAVLGGDADLATEPACRLLVSMLFPALGAHTLREHWGAPADTIEETRRWAAGLLRPDGPVPPIRVGMQPYGVWPVSAWHSWDDREIGVDPPVVQVAAQVRDRLASMAGLGTVEGAGAERLWELLAQTPWSTAFAGKVAIPLPRVAALTGGSNAYSTFVAELEPEHGELGLDVNRAVVPAGAAWELPLGLVLPRVFDADGDPLRAGPRHDDPYEVGHDMVEYDPTGWIARCCEWFLETFTPEGIRDHYGAISEDVTWWPASLWWRLVATSGIVALTQALADMPLEPGQQPLDPADPLMDRATRPLQPYDGAAYATYMEFVTSLDDLLQLCATSPSDVVPVLERIVAGLLDTTSHRVDPWLTGAAWRRLTQLDEDRPLGLYAWVDGPLDGVPGPDDAAGVHLAPSVSQARLAAILRDKALRDPDDRWDLQITSARVRAAIRLADDVRAGAHPSEAVGREVERLIDRRAVIDAVRARWPVRHEHAGRRTCDGLVVLDTARRSPDQLAAEGVDPATIDEIAALDGVLDAYADLLIAEAVDHAVDGRPTAAAQALDAAAGLAVTPDLAALSTPARGRSVRTTVLTALPVGAPADPLGSPLATANPSLAAWLPTATGFSTDPASPDWTCFVDGDPGITIAELPYFLGDALLVDDLDSVARLALSLPPTATITWSPAVEALRREAAALGTRPPSSVELDLAPDAATTFDREATEELRQRLTDTRQAATTLRDRLRSAAIDDDRRAALIDATRWAIAPPVVTDELDLAAAAEEAADRIDERLDATEPDSAGDAATVVGHLHRLIGRSIPIALEGHLPVPSLTAEPADADGRPSIDSTWLEVIAAVRPAIARLDAAQHVRVGDGRTPLGASSSHPGNPWLTPPDTGHDVPHLVVAYGPPSLDLESPPASGVAWTVLDSFAEAVPTGKRTAGMAMRFNAPSAQAPNAILVAVTPRLGEDVDNAIALDVVSEARATAIARMVRCQDVRAAKSPTDPPPDRWLPSGPWVPSFENGGFRWQAPANYGDFT